MASGIEIQSPEYKREDLYVSPFIGEKSVDRPSLDIKATLDEGRAKAKAEALKTNLSDLDNVSKFDLFKDVTISPTIPIIGNYGKGKLTTVANPDYEKAMQIQQQVLQLKTQIADAYEKNPAMASIYARKLIDQFSMQTLPEVNRITANSKAVADYMKGFGEDKNFNISPERHLQRSMAAKAFGEGKSLYFAPLPLAGHQDLTTQILKTIARVQGKTASTNIKNAGYDANGIWYETVDGVKNRVNPQDIGLAVNSAFATDPELIRAVEDKSLAALYDLQESWGEMTNVEKEAKAKELGITIDKDKNFDPNEIYSSKKEDFLKGMRQHYINVFAKPGEITQSRTFDPFKGLKEQAALNKDKAEKTHYMGASTVPVAGELAALNTFDDVRKNNQTELGLAILGKELNTLAGKSDAEITAFLTNPDFIRTIGHPVFSSDSYEAYFSKMYDVLKKNGYDLSGLELPPTGFSGWFTGSGTKEGEKGQVKAKPGAFRKMLVDAKDLFSKKPELFIDAANSVLDTYGKTKLPDDYKAQAATYYPKVLTFTSGDTKFQKSFDDKVKALAETSEGIDMTTGKTASEALKGKSIVYAQPTIGGITNKFGIYVKAKDPAGNETTHTIFPGDAGQNTLRDLLATSADKTLRGEGSPNDMAVARSVAFFSRYPQINATAARNKPIAKQELLSVKSEAGFDKLVTDGKAIDKIANVNGTRFTLYAFNAGGTLTGVLFDPVSKEWRGVTGAGLDEGTFSETLVNKVDELRSAVLKNK